MKIVSAHQPAFLPWLGYIEKIGLSDQFILMNLAKFRKRAFMHRNKIEINQKPHYLGFHLEKNADYLNCNEVYINKNFPKDLSNISEKIKNTYKKSKFYEDIEFFCKECFVDEINNKNLVEICSKQILFFVKVFEFNTEIELESDLIGLKDLEKLSASERLLSHAKILNADIYVTGINSQNYLDKNIFENNNIINYVQEFNYEPYFKSQNCNDCLSIVHQISQIGIVRLKQLIWDNITKKKEDIKNEVSKKN